MTPKNSSSALSVIGVGTDIIEISRFREAMSKHGEKFLVRLFSERERAHCLRYKDPTSHFAVRFSAKEAVVKALGEGFGKHIAFLDIEILNHPTGQPYVELSNPCKAHFNDPQFHLSMSHSRDYATAVALAFAHS